MTDTITIEDETYRIDYDPKIGKVDIAGVMRLNGLQEYAPISALLSNAVQEQKTLALDLSRLEFLNSSGIAVLSKFIIEVRNRADIELTLEGSKDIAWQAKSLPNLKRLMPALELAYK
ncbi:MAG: slr1659 superfamily regulator [Rhodospirillaceae bacterium]